MLPYTFRTRAKIAEATNGERVGQKKRKEKGRSTHTCNSTQTISSILRIAETKQITCNHIINAALFMLIEIQKVYFAITFFPDACRRILYIHTLIKIGNNK